MKADHRHELQTNDLAAWLENAVEKTKPYARAIVGVCVAVAIIIAVYAYVGALERRGTTAAAEQLISAIQFGSPAELQALVDQHRGTQPAALAQLLLAERLLDQGTDALYNDKSAGKENLLKASDAFQSAEQNVRDPMLRAWAMYGIGRAHEAMGDLDRARTDYERLVKEYPDSALTESGANAFGTIEHDRHQRVLRLVCQARPPSAGAGKRTGHAGTETAVRSVRSDNLGGDLKLPSALNPSASGGPATPADDKPSGDAPATEPGADPPSPILLRAGRCVEVTLEFRHV